MLNNKVTVNFECIKCNQSKPKSEVMSKANATSLKSYMADSARNGKSVWDWDDDSNTATVRIPCNQCIESNQ